MNNQLKNILGLTLVITLLAIAYGTVSYVRSFALSTQPASFTVSGEGEVVAIPDVAQFSFSVVIEGGLDVGALQQENTDKMNAALEFLKEQGIETADIKTQSYNIQPRYQFCRIDNGFCPPLEIVGYSVSQSVLVKTRDFNSIGQILSGIVERGANIVSQLSFTIDDPTELQNEAREKAMQQAQQKAQAIAKAGGFRIGRLILVQEGRVFTSVLFTEAAFVRDTGGPSIEPGSQEVKVSITLQYEIR